METGRKRSRKVFYTDDLVLRCSVTKFAEFERVRQGEVDVFSELVSGIGRVDLTVDSFLAELRPYLESFDSANNQRHTADEDQIGDGIKCSEEGQEKEILLLLRKKSTLLGQAAVLFIIQSSLAVKYWKPIQILLHSKVVSGHVVDELVKHIVEAGNALVICSCMRHVLDLQPSHILAMMRFILAGSQGYFQQVRNYWKDSADIAIKFAARKQNGLKLGGELDGKSVQVTQLSSFRSAIALAMAVDGFAAYEVCLHAFVASEQDEAVLASVIGMLNTDEVRSVLRYLSKWVDKYNGRLYHYPVPKGTKKCRIPTFLQVLLWASIVLDVHYARFAVASDVSAELRTLQQSIRTMAEMSSKVSWLAGVTEHLRTRKFLPTQDHFGDCFVQYIDV